MRRIRRYVLHANNLYLTAMDFSFFLEPPQLDVTATLTIEALAPLSMSASQPGTYYRSQRAPTRHMLYGLLENAMGIHLPANERKKTLKKLRKAAKKKLGRGHELKKTPWIKGRSDAESGSGFVSMLQHHLTFNTAILPEVKSFDDLWARHTHGSGTSFPGGSQHHDVRLTSLVNRSSSGDISFGDRASYDIRDPEELTKEVPDGAKVHVKAIRPQFPQFYSSPTPREYVIPQNAYRYRIQTTETLAQQVQDALEDPAGPLYLGTNDGWVEARLDILQT